MEAIVSVFFFYKKKKKKHTKIGFSKLSFFCFVAAPQAMHVQPAHGYGAPHGAPHGYVAPHTVHHVEAFFLCSFFALFFSSFRKKKKKTNTGQGKVQEAEALQAQEVQRLQGQEIQEGQIQALIICCFIIVLAHSLPPFCTTSPTELM
jgi:hypothetical protein